MSNKKRSYNRKGGAADRRISIRSTRKSPPDLAKLSRAVIAHAMRQAAAEAAAQQQADARTDEVVDIDPQANTAEKGGDR